MGNDRTGGIRRKARIKPPVVSFSESFSPKSEPPTPFAQSELGSKAKEKGFVDGETEQAQDVLSRIGYQHASAYFDIFKGDDGAVIHGSSLRSLHQCVVFDRKFQALLMEYIGLFELQFRAQYAYYMSNERGVFAHRNPGNFKDKDNFKGFLKRYCDEFNRQLKKGNPDICKAFDTYGDAPVWIAVEVMSFGTLSMLYHNTKSKAVRKGVAASFRATPEELESWTRAISAVRNTCAHFGRLCGTKLTSKPKVIPGLPQIDNGTPFYIVLLLAYLLQHQSFDLEDPSISYEIALLRDFTQLFNDFTPFLEMCGIPQDWCSYLFNKACCGIEVEYCGDFLERTPGGAISITVRTDHGSVNVM